MGTKFFYRDIDLVYFVNNKLINSCASTAHTLYTPFKVTELLVVPRRGMRRIEYKFSYKSLTRRYLNPLQVASPHVRHFL